MSRPITSSSALGARRQQLSETKAAERYVCFGQFHVDLQREELFKEGSRVRIPSKVFQVLLALVERPGEIVTREAMRARLWPEGAFVNYDANVNTTVNTSAGILLSGDRRACRRTVEDLRRVDDCGGGRRGGAGSTTSGITDHR